MPSVWKSSSVRVFGPQKGQPWTRLVHTFFKFRATGIQTDYNQSTLVQLQLVFWPVFEPASQGDLTCGPRQVLWNILSSEWLLGKPMGQVALTHGFFLWLVVGLFAVLPCLLGQLRALEYFSKHLCALCVPLCCLCWSLFLHCTLPSVAPYSTALACSHAPSKAQTTLLLLYECGKLSFQHYAIPIYESHTRYISK